jgi:hypothetical protein
LCWRCRCWALGIPLPARFDGTFTGTTLPGQLDINVGRAVLSKQGAKLVGLGAATPNFFVSETGNHGADSASDASTTGRRGHRATGSTNLWAQRILKRQRAGLAGGGKVAAAGRGRKGAGLTGRLTTTPTTGRRLRCHRQPLDAGHQTRGPVEAFDVGLRPIASKVLSPRSPFGFDTSAPLSIESCLPLPRPLDGALTTPFIVFTLGLCAFTLVGSRGKPAPKLTWHSCDPS